MARGAKRGAKPPNNPAPKRSRGSTAGSEQAEADFELPTHRYDVFSRTQACVAFLACLDLDDQVHIKDHGDFKGIAARRLAAGYTRAWETLRSLHLKGLPLAGDAAQDPPATESADDCPSSGGGSDSDAAAHDTDSAPDVDTESRSDAEQPSRAASAADSDSSFATAQEELSDDEGAPAPQPRAQLKRLPPGWKAWKRRVQAWVVQLLKTGTLTNAPPHASGYKSMRNIEHLKKIRELLMRGNVTVDERGVKRRAPYRSLAHFRAVNRQQHKDDPTLSEREPSLETLLQRCSITTLPTLWRQLRQQFPQLRRVKQRVRRVRADRAAVMVCLDMLLLCVCVCFALACVRRCPQVHRPHERHAHARRQHEGSPARVNTELVFECRRARGKCSERRMLRLPRSTAKLIAVTAATRTPAPALATASSTVTARGCGRTVAGAMPAGTTSGTSTRSRSTPRR